MIQALSGVVSQILSFFYGLVNNYGVAIIMLTISINIIMFPLTRKQLQSSKKMQDIQPELNRIKEKYKNDKEKLNQATMEYMSKNKVNPLGGCLPLLIQFPIMIAVFQLLRSVGVPDNPLNPALTIPNFNPHFLIWILTESDKYYILPILAAGATFLQQKMMITDPSQKMMMYISPVMILVISLNLPSGLILYWFTNSVFSVGNSLMIKKDIRIFPGGNKPADSSGNKNTKEILESKETGTTRGLGESTQEKAAKTTAEKESDREKRDSQAPLKAKKQKVLNKGPKKKNVKGKKKGAGNSK